MISAFSSALSPNAEMIAPACPMRRPRGADKPGDVADDRLRHVVARPQRRLGLLRAADLADHHHGIGLVVLLEALQHVDERAAVDRIAANADARAHADSERLHLRRGLVAERARARDDAHAALRDRCCPGMMPIIALPGEMTPAQLGPMSVGFVSRG